MSTNSPIINLPEVAATATATSLPTVSSMSESSTGTPSVTNLLQLPREIQVNLLTYLRAYDLAAVQQTCTFYSSRELIHTIVAHTAEHVYPADLTSGFAEQPLAYASSSLPSPSPPPSKPTAKTWKGKKAKPTLKAAPPSTTTDDSPPAQLYSFEHLRNMELLVVARVLSRPEPATGYFVSKSWCKTALRWLEVQEQQRSVNSKHNNSKKLSKKKQRLRERRLSDVSPPWPNVNSDLLCEHHNLQRCSNSKSARARRRLLDKQAWKILRRIYPDSTQLESCHGECLQCIADIEMARKSEKDKLEQAKLERKRVPLSDALIRCFYTRTRGLPTQCLVPQDLNATTKGFNVKRGASITEEEGDKKPAARNSGCGGCPLKPGLYCVLPRAWCHGWRRYIRTGEGSTAAAAASCPLSTGATQFPPPDAACLLCDAHRLPLLPPHLEAFLYGECPQLLMSHHDNAEAAPPRNDGVQSPVAASASASAVLPPGQAPDEGTLEAMRAAGLSDAEVGRQLSAMRRVEQQVASMSLSSSSSPSSTQQQPQEKQRLPNASSSNNEWLDRENHTVVEILTEEEYAALVEKGGWGNTARSSLFSLRFDVDAAGFVTFGTPPCRECDASGLAQNNRRSLCIKNRARRSVKKSSIKARAPASLEY